MTSRAILLLLLPLVGCQASNPYTASRLPYPPAPAEPAMARSADPGSYPQAPRSFARYNQWQWQTPVAEPLAGIVSAELDQRGLRPGSALSPATLELRVQMRDSIRQRLEYDEPHLGVGYGHYHPRYGYWGGAPYPVARSVSYRVVEVEVAFRDAASGEPLWQGAGTAEIDSRTRDEALRLAVRRALQGFPPP